MIVDGVEVAVTPGASILEAARQARMWIPTLCHPGTVFMPFHFAEAAANELTNAALDPVAKIPEYKVCAVAVEREGK